MKYCEHCLNVIEPEDEIEGDDECPYCCHEGIREAKDNDYCHVISKIHMWKEVIDEVFQMHHIPFETTDDKSDEPLPQGIPEIITYDYYVQYKYYARAQQLMYDYIYAGSYYESRKKNN